MSPNASLVNRRTGQGLSAFGFITFALVILLVVSDGGNAFKLSPEAQSRIQMAKEAITNMTAKLDQVKSKPELAARLKKRIKSCEKASQDLAFKTSIYNDVASAFPTEQSLDTRAHEIDQLVSKLTRKVDALELSGSLRRAWDWSNQDMKHRIGVGAGAVAGVGAVSGSIYWIVQKVVNSWKTPEPTPSPQPNVTNNSSGPVTTEKKPQSDGGGLFSGWIVRIVVILLFAGGFMYCCFVLTSRRSSEGRSEPSDEEVKELDVKDLEARKSQIDAKKADGSESGETTILPSIRSNAKSIGSTKRPTIDKSKPKSGKSFKNPKTSSDKSISESSTF